MADMALIRRFFMMHAIAGLSPPVATAIRMLPIVATAGIVKSHNDGVSTTFTNEPALCANLTILVCTPKNASWWNAIEQTFADIQKKVLNNSAFRDIVELKDAVKNRLPELRARLKELLEINGGRFAFAFDLWKEMTATTVPLLCCCSS